MTYVTNAAAVWIAPVGIVPSALAFDLVPAAAAWMIVLGVLVTVCALLAIVTNPGGVLGRRPRLRVVRPQSKPKRRPQPQAA
jgi:hypothetical protein